VAIWSCLSSAQGDRPQPSVTDHDHAGLLLEASNTIMASSVQGEGFFSSACAAASYQGR